MNAPAELVIPRVAYLRLDALLSQARELRGELERIRRAARAITCEPDGRYTDDAVLRCDAPDAVILLQRLGIRVVEPADSPDDMPSAPRANLAASAPRGGNSPVGMPIRTIFTLDQAGRPHVIEVRAHSPSQGPGAQVLDEALALTDGTPVERAGRGRYRIVGATPPVELFAADADARSLPPAGVARTADGHAWSATDTAPARVRRPEAHI
jgi:hypothetical protein